MNFSILLVFSFFLLACDAFYTSPPANHPHSPPANHPYSSTPGIGAQPPASNNTSPPISSEWGVVKCHSSQYQDFNQEVKKFLSTSSRDTRHLNVDCRGQENTKGGMFLRGSVQFKNNRLFDPSSYKNDSLEVAESSHLELHIIGIGVAHVRTAHVIRLQAIPYGSLIDKNHLILDFKDDKGKVSLDGTVEAGIFSGTLSYKNYSNQFEGVIGHFVIHTCRFLQCQEATGS